MRFSRFLAFVPQGSIVLAATTLGSYAFGLLRDRIFAHTFGASAALDAYNAAFLVPDFIFNVFIASGIAAAFIPLFTELSSRDEKSAQEYANNILTIASSTMAFIAIVVFLFAGHASRIVGPGFTQKTHALTAHLMRVLVFSPILFAASNALGALLIAKNRFLFYGLSPLFYNAGIIGGTILLAPHFGITGVVFGTLFGAFLHLCIRLIDALRIGFRFHLIFSLRTPAFRKTLALMLPKMFGHPVELATFWGFTAIASTLAQGSIAVLNFARNFQSVPVSVIGIAVGTAVFPKLARAANERSWERFRHILVSSALLITVSSIAAALFAFLVRKLVIGLFLGGAAFDATAVAKTASVFGIFTLAIPTETLSQLFARAYYATKNTTIPVALSVLSLCIAVLGGWLLAPSLGLYALPLMFAVGSGTKTLLLGIFLPWRIRKFNTGDPTQ